MYTRSYNPENYITTEELEYNPLKMCMDLEGNLTLAYSSIYPEMYWYTMTWSDGK